METVKRRWDKLDAERSGVLQRARDAAALTIPAIMPPDGSDENTVLPTPFQSLGARGVNNLGSKLLLALFPGTPFFRLQIDEEILAEFEGKSAEVDEAFRRLENSAMRRLDGGNRRVVVHAALKHMIVTGNALLHLPDDVPMRMYRLDQYVVQRDPQGTVTEIIIKESVHPDTLPAEVRALLDGDDAENKDRKDVDLYTHIKLVPGGKFVEWQQYLNNKEIEGSKGRAKVEESPYLALRWQAAQNEDYGRGLIEEYIGDLRSLEGISKAIVGFSAVAAKILLLLHPNSATKKNDLTNAENGDVIIGNIEDIDVLQLDKYQDFQVSKAVADDLTLRLSHAFLLQSGTVRDAERVTAEEIRAQAQELEDVLGGVYTVQSLELQLPIVRREIAAMKKEGLFPKIPKIKGRDAVEPVIITGFDALGRGHELNRLRAYFADMVALDPTLLSAFHPQRLAQQFATKHNVDIKDLLKTEEEVTADQQAQAASQLVDKAAGPVAGAMAKSATEQRANS